MPGNNYYEDAFKSIFKKPSKKNKTFNEQTLSSALKDKNFLVKNDTYNMQNCNNNLRSNKQKSGYYQHKFKSSNSNFNKKAVNYNVSNDSSTNIDIRNSTPNNTSNSSKKLKKLYTCAIVFIVIVVCGFVGYSVYNNFSLKNKANVVMENDIVSPNIEIFDSSISNLPCNFCESPCIVKYENSYLYCGNDGIYVIDNALLDNHGKKIYDKSCSSINIYDNKVYFYDITSKSIKEIVFSNSIENVNFNDVFVEENFQIKNFAIYENKIYCFECDGINVQLKIVDLQDTAKQNIVLSEQANDVQMHFSKNSIVILLKGNFFWKAFKVNLNVDTLGVFEVFASGSESVDNFGFGNNKLFMLKNNYTNNVSLITMSDKTGNRSEISLDFVVSKILVSENSIFVSNKCDVYLINANTKIPHKIESENLRAKEIENINLIDNNLFVLYADNSTSFVDLNKLTLGGM